MLAGLRVSNLVLPSCILPDISSTVSRPLVTNHLSLGDNFGLFISMRLLSKYCTRRVPDPSGASAYGSIPDARGAGPQVHDRDAAREATGRSLRIHTLSNAESANGMEAGRLEAAAWAGWAAVGVQPMVKLRVAMARSILVRECDGLWTFVICVKILFS